MTKRAKNTMAGCFPGEAKSFRGCRPRAAGASSSAGGWAALGRLACSAGARGSVGAEGADWGGGGGLPAARGEGLRGNRGGTGVEIVTSRRVAAGTARDVGGRPPRRGKFGARLFLTLEQKKKKKKKIAISFLLLLLPYFIEIAFP